MFFIQQLHNIYKSNKSFILIYLLNTFLLTLYIYYTSGYAELVFPLSSSLLLLLLFFLIRGVSLYSFTKKLAEANYSPKIDFDYSNFRETIVFSTTNAIHSKYQKELYEVKTSFANRNKLFSQWVHNMKVSVSIIDLATRRGKSYPDDVHFLQDIIDENNKLKVNLEECLNILRMDDFSRDYIPNQVNLHAMVSGVINSKKKDFIYNGVYPKVHIESSIVVHTDSKWCSYILEQIISNSIKYTKPNQNKSISISAEETNEEVQLLIQDEGIGIPLEDLPRVFQPFFTGENGRTNESASGIGLYMSKYIAEKLEHKISIKSEVGQGTTVTIVFLKRKRFL